MSDTRKLTIGVTINLGNSGNLHLEVSDTAETEEEAAELRQFIASVLDGYGTGDASVRAAITGYRTRVLADAGSTDASVESDADEPEISMDMFSAFTPESPVGEESSDVADSLPAEDVAQEPTLDTDDKRVEIDEDDYLRLPPAPLVEESAEEFVCSKCGASVSKLQRDVSMLFNHKILCKDCMR